MKLYKKRLKTISYLTNESILEVQKKNLKYISSGLHPADAINFSMHITIFLNVLQYNRRGIQTKVYARSTTRCIKNVTSETLICSRAVRNVTTSFGLRFQSILVFVNHCAVDRK